MKFTNDGVRGVSGYFPYNDPEIGTPIKKVFPHLLYV